MDPLDTVIRSFGARRRRDGPWSAIKGWQILNMARPQHPATLMTHKPIVTNARDPMRSSSFHIESNSSNKDNPHHQHHTPVTHLQCWGFCFFQLMCAWPPSDSAKEHGVSCKGMGRRRERIAGYCWAILSFACGIMSNLEETSCLAMGPFAARHVSVFVSCFRHNLNI